MTGPFQQPPGYHGPGYGHGYGPPNYGPPPENHLVWAILTTIMCCVPLGVVAIVKSNQVQTLWFSGQFDAAHKAANDAKLWSIWAALSLPILLALYVIFVVFVFGVGFLGIFGASSL